MPDSCAKLDGGAHATISTAATTTLVALISISYGGSRTATSLFNPGAAMTPRLRLARCDGNRRGDHFAAHYRSRICLHDVRLSRRSL
jgi:hypothetical protein